MYNNLKTNIHFKYKNIKITCEKYLCKIIDFGWASQKPGFRTTEYHEKYFKQNKIISEVVLFSFFIYKQLIKVIIKVIINLHNIQYPFLIKCQTLLKIY